MMFFLFFVVYMKPDILSFAKYFLDFHLYYQYIFGCLALKKDSILKDEARYYVNFTNKK